MSGWWACGCDGALRGRRSECAGWTTWWPASAPATVRCWSSVVTRGSGRPSCSTTWSAHAEACRVARAPGSSPRWSSRSPVCTSCAPLLASQQPPAAAAARRAGGRVRTGVRRPAGQVPGRRGCLESVVGGGGEPATAVRHRRRAVAGSGLGSDADVRRTTAVRGPHRCGVRRTGAGDRARVEGFPSWWSAVCRTGTPGLCSMPSYPGGWTNTSGTGSWRRPGAIRWPCWSCREG